MRHLLFLLLIAPIIVPAQDTILPKGLAPHEHALIPAYRESRANLQRDIVSPPPLPVRTMGEWEEVQALCVTWTGYPVILKQIVRYAKEECEVLIICSSSGGSSQSSITSYLLANNAGGPPLPDMNNISFRVAPFNSIWIRDYGPETMYFNEVDSLVLLDWIYNRPRPADDLVSDAIGNSLGIEVFNTTQAPNDLVHTGGNFMADGFGTAFSSNLVLEENGPSGTFNQTNKSAAQVDALMDQWMGIDAGRYVKMTTLPYDGIHHIDMHMKLVDEETLLVGEFPPGVSDGPQLEANLQYVLNNYNSVFGTPYEVVRIPMVPSTGGAYPPSGYYRTYANNIFINKTVLVPTYREQYDTTGLRILRETLPGYRVIGIDCDDTGANIISAGGAIHCITKAIGVSDPLLIRHQRLRDTNDQLQPYEVEAYIRHKTGIAQADLYWSADTANGFNVIEMQPGSGNNWTAAIPAHPAGTTLFYYIHATANNGKQIARPIVAPEGAWRFNVVPGGSPAVKVDLNVMLEGPFNSSNGLMNDDLRTAGLVPLQEPYGDLGLTISGIDQTNNSMLSIGGSKAVVDWIAVEVRSAIASDQVQRTRAVLLLRDGSVISADGGPLMFDLPPGNYHVAVRHRNHLGCMTAMAIPLSSASAPIDLSDPNTATWGSDARKPIGNVRVLWAGDVDPDGVVKYTGANNDRDPILVRIGGTVPTNVAIGYHPEDVNLDGEVKYTGPDNDRDPILQNIGGIVPTFTRAEQLP